MFSDDDVLTLGSEIGAAYNDFINQTYSTCDESYRQIGSYSVDTTLGRRRLSNGVLRQAQALRSYTILFGIEGRCGSCFENSTMFDEVNSKWKTRSLSQLQQMELPIFLFRLSRPNSSRKSTFLNVHGISGRICWTLFWLSSLPIYRPLLKAACVSVYIDISRRFCHTCRR
jgi:hypothetical protein